MPSPASTRTLALAGIIAALGALVFAVAIGLATGGDDGRFPSGSPVVIDASEATIEVRDFDYLPPVVSVPAGTTVAWTNYDEADHTSTEKTGLWDSGRIKQDESWSRTFADAGRFEYICSLHPGMRATVIVR